MHLLITVLLTNFLRTGCNPGDWHFIFLATDSIILEQFVTCRQGLFERLLAGRNLDLGCGLDSNFQLNLSGLLSYLGGRLLSRGYVLLFLFVIFSVLVFILVVVNVSKGYIVGNFEITAVRLLIVVDSAHRLVDFEVYLALGDFFGVVLIRL